MRMVDVIEKKRNGKELTPEEIRFVITGYTNGSIPDYQMSAFAMAVFFQGMNNAEMTELTMAMVESGDTIDLTMIDGVKVDKHSTGGVGDKTTLVLAPLVASVGAPVAKMSGRGLGHTGGTLDKLEAIEGFQIELSETAFVNQVNEIGIAVIGQSGDLTPADKKLYALRDVTATVDSIPLIASSIMSKKIAAGSDAICLDVKVGSGAFMKDIDSAKALAQAMVGIAHHSGRKAAAFLTNMQEPLGFAIGNALEIKEAIDTLKGHGPQDLTELSLIIGSYMVYFAQKAESVEEARKLLEANIANGRAYAKFEEFIQAQHGDLAVIQNLELLPTAVYTIPVYATETGYIQEIEAIALGHAAMTLGAGRQTKEDAIDYGVGIVLTKKVGDFINEGDVIAYLHANRENVTNEINIVLTGIHIEETLANKLPLIYEIITD
ncbi:MAG: pyrimidine-nucleoside phosphorylase [Culicoidibacterales bacterium]